MGQAGAGFAEAIAGFVVGVGLNGGGDGE